MADEPGRGTLAFVIFEAALLGVLLVMVLQHLLVEAGALSGVAVALHVVALVLLALFAAAPLWVYHDVRRAGDDEMWVHATILPAINLFGLAAYLHHRRRRGAD